MSATCLGRLSSFGYSGTIAHGAFCAGRLVESDECASSVSLYRMRLKRSECSVSLIRRVALSRDARKHSYQMKSNSQYAAFCKMWTFTKSQIINHITATEKSQLQLQSVSTCLNNQPDEIEIALGSRSLLKTQNMSQS